jgi:hypothetical protein
MDSIWYTTRLFLGLSLSLFRPSIFPCFWHLYFYSNAHIFQCDLFLDKVKIFEIKRPQFFVFLRPPFGVSRWPLGKPLAGRPPLGVSHWLPLGPSPKSLCSFGLPALSPKPHGSCFFVQTILSTCHRTVKIANEMESHDESRVILFVSHEQEMTHFPSLYSPLVLKHILR